uniref:Enoyl-CoA hydratase n=1 Tax=Acrobeloides nanus TaxID=290746 RepID=A0A914CUB7_9BILA
MNSSSYGTRTLFHSNLSFPFSRSFATQSTKAAQEIKYEKKGNIFYILFDRPHKKNAMTVEMYEGLAEATQKASQDKDTILTVFKGIGGSFSSGNDFGPDNFEKFRKNPTNWKPFIDELIKHEKPVIALVDGAAIGIGCTMLGLCDHVIASDV